MAAADVQEQLVKHLADAHSIEQQAAVQMELAPRIAGDPGLAGLFRHHLLETRDHERLVRERLSALGAAPNLLKDLGGQATGVGFALFARFNPDSPGKLVAHGYSYEHMERAAYLLLAGVARRAGDSQTAAMACGIEEQERMMAERLADSFDLAATVSLQDLAPEDLTAQVTKYLQDAHAIEGQSALLLEKAPQLAGAPELAAVYEQHLGETREHQRLVEERLRALGAAPSALKDAALRLGALNWGMFFATQPDTPSKLAGFAYALEHLEVAGYELLRRVAQRAGDAATDALAQRILDQENLAAQRLHEHFDAALDAGLREQGLATS